MLNSLLRPFQGRRQIGNRAVVRDDDPVDSPGRTPRQEYGQHRYATADFTEADDDDDDEEESNDERPNENEERRPGDNGPEGPEDEDGQQHSLAVLPLFSASHLGMLEPACRRSLSLVCS